jgi:hypothetical protein
MAVSCWLAPLAKDNATGLGVMAMEDRVAELTVSLLDPDTPR